MLKADTDIKTNVIILLLCSCTAFLYTSAAIYASPVSPVREDATGTITTSGMTHREFNTAGYRMLKAGRYHEAEVMFRCAIRKHPVAKYYHNNLAVACMNQGKYTAAYSSLQTAIYLDGNYVRALSNMAITCFHLFKFREAYSYYRRVRSIDAAYAQNRFESKRVMERVDSLRKEHPRNRELHFIFRYLQNGNGVTP